MRTSSNPDIGGAIELLDSWKEIAAYLRRDIRTLHRWEREEALPIYRHVHKKSGTVYAYKSEIDAWRGNRRPRFKLGEKALARAAPRQSGSTSVQWVRLAVLPFENLSGNTDQEYFSDGLTEEMITQLSCLQQARLKVIARTSVMQYKGTRKDVSQIGRELGVDYVLEGSVRRDAERVRISAQLIRVSDQTHLCAESYDRDLSDILSLQREVTQAIVREIKVAVTPEEARRLTDVRLVNPDAYEAYRRRRQPCSEG